MSDEIVSLNKCNLKCLESVGELLFSVGNKHGESIILDYFKRLTNELGKDYTFTSLTRMKKFYMLIEKVATVSQQLLYGHYIELLPFDNLSQIKYYIKIVEEQSLSIIQLREKIKFKQYERLPEDAKNKLISKVDSSIGDFVSSGNVPTMSAKLSWSHYDEIF